MSDNWLEELLEQGRNYDLRYLTFVALGYDHVCSYYFANGIFNWQLADWINQKNPFTTNQISSHNF